MQEREIVEPGIIAAVPARFSLGPAGELSSPAANRALPHSKETASNPSKVSAPLIRVSTKLPGKVSESSLLARSEAAGEQNEPTPPRVEDPTHSPTTPDQQRRLALAQWIADPGNPLPARV